jgi:hypothetical protein
VASVERQLGLIEEGRNYEGYSKLAAAEQHQCKPDSKELLRPAKLDDCQQ